MAEIYRKAALERLSSPEQLDKMIKITSPSLWVSFVGFIAIVVAVIIWAIFGTLPENMSVAGVYTDTNATYYVYSSGTGEITNLHFAVGDVIEKGDTIAELHDINADSQLENRQENMAVVSPYSGTITGMYIQKGQIISQGSQVLKIKQSEVETENNNVILCYVPLSNAKKIEQGMKAIATPSTVNEQEYGHMTGTVLYVGEYCTDSQEMMMKLGDELLVNSFQQQGPVIEVLIALDKDTTTESGYAWSNKKGNQVKLTENTLIDLKIVVDESAPVSKLIPAIKELLAGETEPETQQQ